MMGRRRGGGSTVVDEEGVGGTVQAARSVIPENDPGPAGVRNLDREAETALRGRTVTIEEAEDTSGQGGEEGEGEEEEPIQREQRPPSGRSARRPDVRTETPPDDPAALRTELEQLRQQQREAEENLRSWNWLQSTAERDPVRAITALAAQLGVDRQIAQLYGGEAQRQQQQAQFDPQRYQPENEFEQAMLPHVGFLQEAPRQIREVIDTLTQQTSYMDNVFIENLALRERLSAIEEELGFNHGIEFDAQKAVDEFRGAVRGNPRLTPAEFIKGKFGKALREKLATLRQQDTERPETLGGGGEQPRYRRAKSWTDAVRLVEEEIARNSR